MTFHAEYQIPARGTLYVHIEGQQPREATLDDLDKFNLAERYTTYWAFDQRLQKLLTEANLISGGLTDAELNPIRHFVELLLCSPDLLDHPENKGWSEIVEIERRLQSPVVKSVGHTNE